MTALSADERGSTTVWLLAMCVVVLALGGISLDLWRAFSDRRAFAGMADAAAAAGAAGIDQAHLRATGEVVLDPVLAERLARQSLAAQHAGVAPTTVAIAPAPDGIRVTVAGRVDLSLLRLLGPDGLPVAVTASAQPVRAP